MAEWKLLSASLEAAGSPTLLLKHDFKDTSYTVFLTDLTYLWTEDLDRKGIVTRGLNDETSIDPSEGREQLTLLLNHIRGGLDGENKTKFIVSAYGNDKELLDLSITSELPSPLKTLSWKLHFKLASQQEFAQEVLLPILASLSATKTEVSSLLHTIREKDQVISRINNNLSSKGSQLVDLFRELLPSKASKDESLLLRKIPGLIPFNDKAWREEHNQAALGSKNELIEQLFRPSLTYREVSRETISRDPWWEKLDAGVEITSAASPPPKSAALLKRETSTNAFQDFYSDPEVIPDTQRNVGSRDKRLQKATAGAHDSDVESTISTSSTASELEAPIKKASRIKSPQPPPPRKIGKIGGSRPEPARPTSPPATTPRKRTKSPEGSSSPIPKELERNQGRSSPPSPSSPTAPTPAKSKKKIGRIGGCRGSGANINPDSSASFASSTAVQPPSNDSTSQLSQFEQLPTRAGGVEAANKSTSLPFEKDRGRETGGHGKEGNEEEKAETATDDMDRRRAELKESLAEQARRPRKKHRKW